MNRFLIPFFCFCCASGSLCAQEIPAEKNGRVYPLSGEEWDSAPSMEDEEGLTITGTRESTQQMRVISREEIEKANAPELATLLEETAGLGTARYGPHGSQGDINLRGFDTERVAFLIDGIPANSAASGEFDYNQIDLDSVERIEIIYGGSDSRYNVSGAIGGVINIITVKKQKPGLRVAGSVSSMSALPGRYENPKTGSREPQWQDLADTQHVTLSAAQGLENWSWNAAWFGSRAANHFLYDDPYGRRRRKESNEVWDTGLSAALVRELNNLSKLIVNGGFYYGNKNIPKSGYSELYDKLYDISSRANVMLEMPRLFDDAALEASLSHQMQRMDSAGAVSSYHALLGINRWAWYPRPFLTLRAGGDYRYAFMDGSAFHERHDGGLYLGAEWSPAETFTIIPSIKIAQSNGQIVPVPKLGLLWKPAGTLVIKNNYFRSFKFPDLQDLYWQGGGSRGDPDLKPEDGWGGDIGVAWTGEAASGFAVGLEGNGYAQWYDNSIHWYGGTGGMKPRNVGGSFFYGADLRARFTVPLRWGPFTSITLSPFYQFMMSYLLAYGYSFESDKRIPYMPVHRGGAKIELAWKGGSASLNGQYEGLRYAENFITTLDPFFLLTVNANQRLGKNLDAFAVIRNALNQSYQSFKDYPMPGATLTVGLRMHFETAEKENAAGGAY